MIFDETLFPGYFTKLVSIPSHMFSCLTSLNVDTSQRTLNCANLVAMHSQI